MVHKQIISIGGGGFTTQKPALKIEQYLIDQTGKKNPKVCFLPQASAEDNRYIVKFYEAFLSLGSNPSSVSLFGRVEDKWKQHLLEQDLIYVGGGNTRTMLAIWREWGMDKILKEAYEKGIVLSGISAGAICWFEQCVTDSVWPLGSIKGMEMLKGSCCPHYDTEPERKPTFIKMVKEGNIIHGIALEDNVAAHYVNGELKQIIAEIPNKSAYQITQNGEEKLNTISI